MENNFEKNREKLYKKIEGDFALVLFSGKAPVEMGDEYYRFSPERNFYYMTGVDSEEVIFFMLKRDGLVTENLFIKRADPEKEKWVGKTVSKEECGKISGIRDIFYLDEFYERLASFLFDKNIEILFLNIEQRFWEEKAFSAEALEFSEIINKRYPFITIKNIYGYFSDLRRVKALWEKDNIKKAVDITKSGIYSMMKNIRPGMMEYELEAYFDFTLKTNGVRQAFTTIVASGKNASVLHYRDNNCEIKNNDLVLFDLGAEYRYYKSDITRTIPSNGKFTERQKTIYDIVLSGQQKVIDSVKPGVYHSELNEILKRFYIYKLKKIGLIHGAGELSNYYYHGVSHMLGLETHDIGGRNEGVIKEGMVLTVEPGLYIAEENIGIRIEDDIYVTGSGAENLSFDIIKTIEDIETYLSNR